MTWMTPATEAKQRRGREAGLSMIELLIAMMVLAVGMMGSMILVRTAIVNNNRNKLDTTATALAQMVLEQITSQPASNNAAFTINDCTGVARTINPAGAAAPGAGANLIVGGFNGGNIDFTQAFGVVPAGYAMQYVTCGPANQQVTYEIRWNVTDIRPPGEAVAPPTPPLQKLVTVSARKQVANNAALPYFSVPVTLRGIGGQ